MPKLLLPITLYKMLAEIIILAYKVIRCLMLDLKQPQNYIYYKYYDLFINHTEFKI